MPRIVMVIIVCAIIAFLINVLLPLPYPWGLLLHVALVVWVLLEVLALAGYAWPGRR